PIPVGGLLGRWSEDRGTNPHVPDGGRRALGQTIHCDRRLWPVKMVVFGASGAGGAGATRMLSGGGEWDLVAVSRRPPLHAAGAQVVALDLTDRGACERVLSEMTDVTHMTYAAVSENPGLVEGWVSRDQMQRNFAMLRNAVEPLETVAKNLEHI